MFNDSHFENDWGIDITRASLWRVSVVTSRRRITSVALHTKTKASSRQLSGNSLFFHEDVLFEGRHRQGCCHRSEDLLYKIKFKKCTFCLVKSHVTRWRRGEVHVHHAYTPSCIYAIMHKWYFYVLLVLYGLFYKRNRKHFFRVPIESLETLVEVWIEELEIAVKILRLIVRSHCDFALFSQTSTRVSTTLTKHG